MLLVILLDSEGIVEDVVLLGAPVEGEAKYWKACAKVVSGRIINGYCRSVESLSLISPWLGRFIPFNRFVRE